jgi:hypothetical protein
MASATFLDKSERFVKAVTTLTYPKTKVNQTNYSVLKASEILPFRIRFASVQIPGFGVNNAPPIGIAVIGVNNYIL